MNNNSCKKNYYTYLLKVIVCVFNGKKNGEMNSARRLQHVGHEFADVVAGGRVVADHIQRPTGGRDGAAS